MMAQGWVKYTTKTWSQGTGGATCTADKDGWYIAKCTFTGDTGNIDAQFQLMAGNTMIGITSAHGWSGNFPAAQCMGFGYFAKGTIFKPYIHTSTAGAIINTYMDLIRIYS